MKQKVIIASDGVITKICINGKVYGDNVVGIEFKHHAEKKIKPTVEICVDTLPVVGEESKDDFEKWVTKLME